MTIYLQTGKGTGMSTYEGDATLIVEPGVERNVRARISYGPDESGMKSWRGMIFADGLAFDVIDMGERQLRIGARTGDILIDRVDLATPDRAHFIGSGAAPLED